MSDGVLLAERILDAAEDAPRRFGPSKTTVVDVARAFHVSHGSVYRHFPSKAPLRDAVAERWLSRVAAPLAAIAGEDGPAIARLRRWLDALIAAKRRKVLDDPELFATYHALALDAREVVAAHVDALVARILADGVAQGAFAVPDTLAAARAVLDATARFHNPVHAPEWADPRTAEAFEGVWRLILPGIAAPAKAGRVTSCRAGSRSREPPSACRGGRANHRPRAISRGRRLGPAARARLIVPLAGAARSRPRV